MIVPELVLYAISLFSLQEMSEMNILHFLELDICGMDFLFILYIYGNQFAVNCGNCVDAVCAHNFSCSIYMSEQKYWAFVEKYIFV